MNKKAAIEILLKRRVEEVIEEKSLKRRLLAGETLRVKLGADPTAPDLHLGHLVVLKKLKEFQDLGHKIIFIIGDFTAKIGDPSGKSATRPPLSDEEIKANAGTYIEQVGKVLDTERAEIRFNSEWFAKEGWREVLEIASQFSLKRILERDDFERRLKGGGEISMVEILYPLMQAYDSVKIKADVEIGGTDQKFNMLAGRALQRRMGQKEQDIITIPLLRGTDGKKKMSKSLGNYIGISEPADIQYGKVMSIPDELMEEYANLLTDLDWENLKKEHPRDAKMHIAYDIVRQCHGEEAAREAQENFVRTFQKKEAPDNLPQIKAKRGEELGEVLVREKIVASKSEFRRLVKSGSIDVNGEPINDPHSAVIGASLVKIGKKKFVKIIA